MTERILIYEWTWYVYTLLTQCQLVDSVYHWNNCVGASKHKRLSSAGAKAVSVSHFSNLCSVRLVHALVCLHWMLHSHIIDCSTPQCCTASGPKHSFIQRLGPIAHKVVRLRFESAKTRCSGGGFSLFFFRVSPFCVWWYKYIVAITMDFQKERYVTM